MPPIIAPSILAADFARLGEAVELINRSEAEWVHIDVMDGVFVPNISFGFPILEAVRKHTDRFLDVHLMIDQPDRFIEQFRKSGADGITLHLEADLHLHRSLQLIRSHGMKAGVALNPHTPVRDLSEVLHDVDLVLVMSVNPGFGGQQFIPNALFKVSELHAMREEAEASFLIQVDGGVGPTNADSLFRAGADVLVSGSAVFKADDPIDTISRMKKTGQAIMP